MTSDGDFMPGLLFCRQLDRLPSLTLLKSCCLRDAHTATLPLPRQVWELDRKLLQTHALPLVEGYTWETGTLLRALDMDEFLPSGPATGAEAKLGGPRVARRIQRSGRCAAVRALCRLSTPALAGVCS